VRGSEADPQIPTGGNAQRRKARDPSAQLL
jgi:hypothetical protein